MPKSGQARVPTREQQSHLFQVIQDHRHPEKNAAIMQVSFKLGLRAQEIALLPVKEVAKLNSMGTELKLLEVMSLPAAYTKGADAMKRSKSHYQRKTISFNIDSFNKVVRQIEALAKSGADVSPEDFYPTVKQHKGRSRDLPMVDQGLRDSLARYLNLRLAKGEKIKPSSPLFITQ
ncbi:hypothetical protein ACJJIW_17195 [Microbulbifer sp. JMSA004]|uniref:hypothetical protein n=1 Tax=Microbulbifer sp. JMSA004 TaxID=3243370 RepID=UPI0040390F9E